VFQTLAQAGYIDGTRTLRLQTVHVAQPVLKVLEAHDEEYVLRCIQVSP
jgi:translation initiation factor 2 beta subunit (eIF-2beta)/eIF-5